ncbi:MAG: hypothetical protein KF764_01585 [Labilithrix sp.]|nr:hypothetical protein [Labilithrix sp.]
MQELIWHLRTRFLVDIAPSALPFLLAFSLYRVHYVFVLVQSLVRLVRYGVTSPPIARRERPAAVLVVPTMLRTADELDGLQKAITSAANNGYPGDLTIVASIDDGLAKPALFAALEQWVASTAFPPRVRVFATYTKQRTGKAVAVNQGVIFLEQKVAEGLLPRFPPLFFNMDADSTLGDNALVLLADRLTKRFPWSRQYPNIVASNVAIARSAYWKGWRELFTVRGMLSIHVAAEFVVAMLGKHNLKFHLVPGASGALYCTWSALHHQGPRWAAFMQTLRPSHLFRWWLGAKPPSFANAKEHLPEAMTGPGDDTWVTWLAYCARWEGGELTLELPRTPAHAFYYFVRGWFLRALQYEPRAVVETKTPTTIKSLFKQRVRWNSSRVRQSQRWRPAMHFHWTLGSPAVISTFVVLYFNAIEMMSLIALPLALYNGYVVHTCTALTVFWFTRFASTAFGIALDGGFKKHGYKLLGLVLAAPYHFVFNQLAGLWGVVQDIFLAGVNTGFAPETTDIKSRLSRVAIGFRLRRAFALAIRAVVYNDVPLGWFWFGWHETKWTPNGFDGWTSGKKPRAILPRLSLRAFLDSFGPKTRPAPAAPATPRVTVTATVPVLVPASARPAAVALRLAAVTPSLTSSVRTPSRRPPLRSVHPPPPSRMPPAPGIDRAA